MRENVERELKLHAPETFSLARIEARLGPYVLSPVTFKRLHTIYYDTEDLRLVRWGCSLRFRGGEGWTLKIPIPRSSAGLSRVEHVFPGDASAVPPEALDLATAYLRGATPKRVAELRTVRVGRHVLSEDGADLAEIVEDDVRVVEGTQVVRRFRQIEIELTEAAPDDVLETLCVLLRHEGAGAPDPVAKDVRALGERASRPELEPPPLDAHSPIGDVARAAFVGSVERLVRLDAALRLREGEEAVHHARVAVRRLRSDLRSFLPLLDPAWACDLRGRLRWLQDGLSAARDADVLLALLRRTAEALPEADRRRADDAVAPLRDARESAYRRLDAMLREPQYVTLLQEVVDAAKRPAFGASASAPARDAIPELVGDAYAVLRKRVRRRARPPSDRDLHAIRIAAKRVRYALEAIVPVAGRPARVFARRVEQLQTVLGEQHDAAVARDRLRTLAAGEEGCDAFVVGELAALAHRAAVEGRDAWRDVWRRVRRARRRLLGR